MYPALSDAALADRLADLAIASGVQPARLALIVPAGALGGGAAVALDVLARLRLKGFGVWLEGIGPSTQLDRVPLTGVRLAPSLIASAATDPGAAAAVRDAVDRARSNGCLAIGTGCAGGREFELLLEVGASHAQGPFVGVAQAPVDLARSAAAWTPAMLVTDDPP
jgi:EAL domain-containing protein (putative c-di-GMP-specific phosphodiesterase class I)